MSSVVCFVEAHISLHVTYSDIIYNPTDDKISGLMMRYEGDYNTNFIRSKLIPRKLYYPIQKYSIHVLLPPNREHQNVFHEVPCYILFSRIRESLFSWKIIVFNSRKLIPIFFLLWYFFSAKNTVSLHLIFLLQLNRESLFSRKMTKAAIRESKFPNFREFVSLRKFLPHYLLPWKYIFYRKN